VTAISAVAAIDSGTRQPPDAGRRARASSDRGPAATARCAAERTRASSAAGGSSRGASR
jgi:hypothetical protein